MNLKQTSLQLITEQSRSAVDIAQVLNTDDTYKDLREVYGVGIGRHRKISPDQVYAAMSGLRSKTRVMSNLIEPVSGRLGKTEVYRAIRAAAVQVRPSPSVPHETSSAPPAVTATEPPWPAHGQFKFRDLVRKKGRANWRGRVVGWYATRLTSLGYAVESTFEPGSVQIYPESALLPWDGDGDIMPAAPSG